MRFLVSRVLPGEQIGQDPGRTGGQDPNALPESGRTGQDRGGFGMGSGSTRCPRSGRTGQDPSFCPFHASAAHAARAYRARQRQRREGSVGKYPDADWSGRR
jgi:hypothetical protein